MGERGHYVRRMKTQENETLQAPAMRILQIAFSQRRQPIATLRKDLPYHTAFQEHKLNPEAGKKKHTVTQIRLGNFQVIAVDLGQARHGH